MSTIGVHGELAYGLDDVMVRLVRLSAGEGADALSVPDATEEGTDEHTGRQLHTLVSYCTFGQPVSQSINQSINQPISQSVSQSASRSFNQSRSRRRWLECVGHVVVVQYHLWHKCHQNADARLLESKPHLRRKAMRRRDRREGQL